MFISRIQITNFRNFHAFDVKLGNKAVIVGENNAGKSNLLFALRLVLDPSLPDSSRYLRQEDFWDALDDPISNGEIIEVAIELQDFVSDLELLAILQQFLVQSDSTTAKFIYQFRPKSPLPEDRKLTIEDYEFIVFGGEDEANRVNHEVRRWIPMDLLQALRDAETDLSSWRRSPLRPLIERLQVPETTLESVATVIDQATDQLLSDNELRSLTSEIESRLSKMIGKIISVGPSLGFASTDPDRLLRTLRMFGDGSNKRSISDLSLGTNNILYLLLLALELERKEANSERASTILAIEEPEAHLHPHIQRLLFRDFLRRESPVLLTTHSPHIASVSPLPSIVLLKRDVDSHETVGRSTLDASLDSQEIADLERYLDASRAEVLFARGVILVEGAAEIFIVPAIAESMGLTLDEYGISVCSVHGTDFMPYVKLLGSKGLDIPFVVITDGDPYRLASSGKRRSRGMNRALQILDYMSAGTDHFHDLNNNGKWEELREEVAQIGVFVGHRTLEVDLFNSGHGSEMVTALDELGSSRASLSKMRNVLEKEVALDVDGREILLAAIDRIGKGRFAQRLSSSINEELCPGYLTLAISQIVEKVSP